MGTQLDTFARASAPAESKSPRIGSSRWMQISFEVTMNRKTLISLVTVWMVSLVGVVAQTPSSLEKPLSQGSPMPREVALTVAMQISDVDGRRICGDASRSNPR